MLYVCFTGHRPDKIGGYENENPEVEKFVRYWLTEATRRIIEKFNDVTFISGCAQGVDTYAAEIILEHKEKYKDKNIKLTLAMPHKGFGDNWPPSAKQRLYSLLYKADKVSFVRESFTNPIVLQIRNEWMVDRSNIVIAVWDGSVGGTRNCFKYAQDMNKKIWRLNLRNGETIKYN